MIVPTVTVEATLQSDGVTLHLDREALLPPGRVVVTLQTVAPRSVQTMLEVLDRIHGEQQQRGRHPTTEEEMVAEIAAMRSEDDEYEAWWRQIWSQTQTPLNPSEES
jgi:uncharacterized damage-inducible protein DinB